MPFAPRRPCKKPGCPALVDGGGYCEKHQANNPDKQRWRDLDRTRGNSSERGYGTYYRKWRALYLKRNVMCSASMGCHEIAAELHHIHPVSDVAWYEANPGAMTDESNVQGLCHRHHLATGNRGGRV